DLALGEIASLDCQVYDAWGAFLGCRFHAHKSCLRVSYCIRYTLFLHSRKGTQASPRKIGGPARGVAQPGWECLQIVRAGVCEPPGGRARENRKFIQASSPEIWSKTISGGEEVLAGKWGGLFLGYLLGKNFRRRKRGFVRRVISEVKISGIDWCLGRNC